MPSVTKENKLSVSKEEQQEYNDSFKKVIKDSLDREGFEYSIKGRTMSSYSIRRKMINQGVSFDEVYDKFAIRIIYRSSIKDEKFDAWKIYSIVTDHFSPNPNRLRDWITHPKTTGYESLHTTVMGPNGKWVEIQIRSERMDEIAENFHLLYVTPLVKLYHMYTFSEEKEKVEEVKNILLSITSGTTMEQEILNLLK